MFDNEKDDPNAIRDQKQTKEAVRVDPETEAPDGDDAEGDQRSEGLPELSEMIDRAARRMVVESLEATEDKYRDQFAVVAMGSIIRGDMVRGGLLEPHNIARLSYEIAEAMLTERAVRESFGHRRSEAVIEAITEGRVAMKARLNEGEAVCNVADGIRASAERAKAQSEALMAKQRADNEREAKLQRVRELVEAETSPGLTAAIIATDLNSGRSMTNEAEVIAAQVEAQGLLNEVRAERRR